MEAKEQHKKIVMAFGTFDLFHAGHEYYLKNAKALGDYLIVVIARDNTVHKIKGAHPVQNERERQKTVKKSPYVDKVILGEKSDKYKVIKKNKPDIIALGYDQIVFTYKLKKLIIDENLNTEIVKLKPYNHKIYKSSLIKARYEEENV